MDRKIAELQEQLKLRLKFRATARLAIHVQKPKNPAALLSSLFREGATGIEALIRMDLPLRTTYNSLIYVGMLGVCLTLIGKGFEEYFTYRIATSMELADNANGAVLPAVTICNVNGFKRSVFCSDENIGVTAKLCRVEHKSEFAGLFLNTSFEPDTFDRLRDIANISEFSEDELIKSCFIKHRPCPDDLLMPKVVSYQRYGMCYCFFCEGQFEDDFVRFTQSSLHDDGLSLVLDSHKDDMLDSTKSSGFIVMLHGQNSFPDVNADGFYITDGRTHFIGISYAAVERLPGPYETKCHVDWPPGFNSPPFENLSLPYATSLCVKICYSLTVLNTCGCRKSGKLTYRDYLDIDSLCLDNSMTQVCRANISSRRMACNCPPTCNEMFYRVHVSDATFVDQRTDDDNKTYSRLVIYYNDIAAQTFREVAELNNVQFLNLLGGDFGMFVGLSFLILYEVLEIHVRWIVKLGRLWHERRTKQALQQQLTETNGNRRQAAWFGNSYD